MSKILVVGDDKEASRVLDELVRTESVVEWAQGLKDAAEVLEVDFDIIIICSENGLAKADMLASELKLIADNMPIVIAVQKGVTDNGARAGIGIGNVDAVSPDGTAATIMKTIDEVAAGRR